MATEEKRANDAELRLRLQTEVRRASCCMRVQPSVWSSELRLVWSAIQTLHVPICTVYLSPSFTKFFRVYGTWFEFLIQRHDII